MNGNDGHVAPASQPRGADLRAREPKAIHRALRVLEAVAEIGPGATGPGSWPELRVEAGGILVRASRS